MSWLKLAGGNPLTSLVNMHQTAEERSDKYRFCRFMGKNVDWSRKMRDWHWTKINLLLGGDQAKSKAKVEGNNQIELLECVN